MPEPSERRFLSIQEAVAEYHVGTTTLFKYLREGKLTRYGRELDRRTLIDRRELDALLRPVKIESRHRRRS